MCNHLFNLRRYVRSAISSVYVSIRPSKVDRHLLQDLVVLRLNARLLLIEMSKSIGDMCVGPRHHLVLMVLVLLRMIQVHSELVHCDSRQASHQSDFRVSRRTILHPAMLCLDVGVHSVVFA